MSAVLDDLSIYSTQELRVIDWMMAWREIARPKQLAPLVPWTTWGIMTGRGFGKTLTGAHWSLEEAAFDPRSYSGLIAPTLDDVRYTLIEGPTGLLGPETGFPQELIYDYNVTNHRITLWNGAMIRGFSAEKPEKLRGPQHSRVWGDEVAAWANAVDVLAMMRFGLRLGRRPQFLWTTTPKPNKIIKKLLSDKKAVIIRGSSYENKDNLSEVFWDEISQYAGTQLGRQELDGEVIDSEEGGLVKNNQIRLWPHDKKLPKFLFVCTSLDTAFSEKHLDRKSREPDYSACHVYGVFAIEKEHHVLLLDAWREHLGFPKLCAKVRKEEIRVWGGGDKPLLDPMYGPGQETQLTGKKTDMILIEDKGSGISLRQQMAAENILTHPYNPGLKDKLMRLHLVTPLFAHRRVWFPESEANPGHVKSWAEPIRSVLCSYAGEGSVDQDDDLDACTQALLLIKDMFRMKFHQTKEEREAADKPPHKKPLIVNPYAQ